jgi:hypothetical protein
LNEPAEGWSDDVVQEDEGYFSGLDAESQSLGSGSDLFFSDEENPADRWDFDAEAFEE